MLRILVIKREKIKGNTVAHHGLNLRSGMGRQVKNTVTSKNDFLPHTSERAPISGALRNDRIP